MKFAAVLIFCFALLSPVFGQAYILTDLGLPAGCTNSSAKAINAKNEVTGELNHGTQWGHAFLYSQGKMSDLGTPVGFTDSVGTAINDGGWITGAATKSEGLALTPPQTVTAQIFRAHEGVLINLDMPGSVLSVSSGINSAGQIVGETITADGANHAFLAADGHVTLLDQRLPPGSGWKLQEANAVNDHGDIVGTGLVGGVRHAFLLRQSKVTDLNSYLPEHSEWVLEQAEGINTKGEIVCLGKHGPASHAFLYTSNGLHDLGTLPDYPNIVEAHLNNRGDVVGQAETASGDGQCAFLYTHGRLSVLNHAIPAQSHWSLEEANGINDSGVIVGTGEYEGKSRAFLLMPKEK